MKRNCPNCNNEIIYKSISGLNYANNKKSLCKNCGYKKQSEIKKGIGLSEDHKNKLSIAKKGKNLSETHKTNIGNAVRGLKRSNESKIKYSLSKIGDKNPAKRKEVREKISNSITELYKNNPKIKDKISESVTDYFLNNQNYVSLLELDEYRKFRKLVDNMTIRNKKELFENWNGIDYYDNEYIKDNTNLDYNDPSYPTIDHKISILEGFKKSYTFEFISYIDNLCITKRKYNNLKGTKSEIEFIKKLGQ